VTTGMEAALPIDSVLDKVCRGNWFRLS